MIDSRVRRTRMPRQLRVVIAFALALQLGLAVWVVATSSALSGTPAPTFVPLTDLDVAGALSLESGQPIAARYAATWHPDARLISAVMRVEWPTSPSSADVGTLPDGGWLIYDFAHDGAVLSIYLDRRTGAYITSGVMETGIEDWPALDFTGAQRSSTTAVLTAEVLHGAEYRRACASTRTTAFVTLTSVRDGTGTAVPAWTVTYGDSRFSGTHDVLVQLDAQNGNVVRSEARDRPCDA